ncbi:hypothetical protein AOC36_00905 [Erysipelothrix larvae]|uniref:HTH arsR-type domain-containing protein n=1 Tax=Erysipelothrix larvae TaxID=1514105 RepID=A0A0X8GY72_9FIRM|nr:winged helix-turn-helix domain-containing protein [Erysipelothrix larvae]AMC92602.1 hypothetical protein AOC36_00905 [Erysipelothrix larvae]
MITINTKPNLAFEAYTFILRKLNNSERYAHTTHAEFKANIDAIYDESTPLFDALFHEKETIRSLFTDLNDVLKINNLLPYYYFYSKHRSEQTPNQSHSIREDMYKYITNLHDLASDEPCDKDASAFHIIQGLNLEIGDKWHLMNFYENSETLYPQYESIMDTVIDFITPYLTHFDSYLNDFNHEWQTIDQSTGLKNHFKDMYKITINDSENITLSPSILGCNQGVFIDSEIFIGVLLNTSVLKRNTLTFESVTRILKLLGDPTKSSILQLLHHKKMYGKELANETGLTPATISYHMQELINEQLISITTQDSSNRIYYQLNNEMLLGALDFAQSMFH